MSLKDEINILVEVEQKKIQDEEKQKLEFEKEREEYFSPLIKALEKVAENLINISGNENFATVS